MVSAKPIMVYWEAREGKSLVSFTKLDVLTVVSWANPSLGEARRCLQLSPFGSTY